MTDQYHQPFDVFLSYPHTEADAVESIGIRLADDAGLRVWLDRWVLVPGEHWQQEMAIGLDQAKTCAVFIGASTPTGWFQEEIERALNRQACDRTFRVIPVILPGGDPSVVNGFLELRTWVEFKSGMKDARALHLLLCGIRGIRPGRRSAAKSGRAPEHKMLREKLSQLRALRFDRLIDDEVAVEYQRRLLDDLIKPDKGI